MLRKPLTALRRDDPSETRNVSDRQAAGKIGVPQFPKTSGCHARRGKYDGARGKTAFAGRLCRRRSRLAYAARVAAGADSERRGDSINSGDGNVASHATFRSEAFRGKARRVIGRA